MPLLFVGLLVAVGAGAQTPQYVISTFAGGQRVPFPEEGTTASAARLILPTGFASNAQGDIFLSDSYHERVFRITAAGAISIYAGTGVAGFSGDGGPAAQARLNQVGGLAVSPAGDLFICDSRNARIRRVSREGAVITTFAGNGQTGRTGDGGLATAAAIGNPRGIVFDTAGNVYFTDSLNSVVRKIDTAGVITTIAGTGRGGFSGDAGPAAAAALQIPLGIAVDSRNFLYIADNANHRIRRISPDGRIETVAGSGTAGSTGDSGPATQARLSSPFDVAVNAAGDLYIADYANNRIRRVRNGTIATIAGTGTVRTLPAPASQFALALPRALGFDTSGRLLLAEEGRKRAYRVNLDTSTIELLAGNPGTDAVGDGGPAVQSVFLQPQGVVASADGSIYVSDVQDHRVRRISPSGQISTAAGTGSIGFSGDGGFAVSADVGRPRGLALDRSGNLFIASTWFSPVRRVTPQGIISTVAGPAVGSGGDGGQATAAGLMFPYAVWADAENNLYIADSGNHRIRRVTPAGTISTIAGTGEAGFAGDGGPAGQARFSNPRGIVGDNRGNLYIADTGNHRVRRIDRSGTITTVAGNGSIGTGGAGGPATAANTGSPFGLAFDPQGNLLIATSAHGQIRALHPDGTLSVVAGRSDTGFSGDGGPALDARLSGPEGLAVSPDGTIYVVDAGNERVRKLELVRLTAGGVANRASGLAGAVCPNEIVLIRGTGLGPETGTTAERNELGFFPKELAGTRVLFDGTPAVVLAAQDREVVAIVPASLGENVRLAVEYRGRLTNEVTLLTAPSAPGIFTTAPEGTGQAVARNEDGLENSEASPALAGSLITFAVTGAGALDTAIEDGAAVADQTPRPVLPVEVTIGGVAAEVAGLRVPAGETAGRVEITARIPMEIEPGAQTPLTVKVGDAVSQPGVTIAVAPAP